LFAVAFLLIELVRKFFLTIKTIIMDENIKKLELRITELENQLKATGGAKANIDPEELKTFQKVSQQLGMGGCINECQPSICVACYHCFNCYHCICTRCNTECICGPCILNQGSSLGGSRFGSLG
jgi:hypothetical protein